MFPDETLSQAFEAYRRGHLDQAAALYEHVLHEQPGNVSVLYNLGIVRAEQGRLRDAERHLSDALRAEPNDPGALDAYGNILAALGETDLAISSYDNATRCDPTFTGALINKGALLHRLGRFEEAIAIYDQILSDHPHNTFCLGNRALSLQALGHCDLALSSFSLAVELDPGDAETLINRGNLLQTLLRFEEAIRDYERALLLNPINLAALTGKGQALGSVGRFEEALTVLDKALQMCPDHVDALLYRGNVFRDQKKLVRAVSSYDSALAVQPDFIRAQRNKGLALLLGGDFDKGLHLYECRKKLDVPIDARNYDAPLWTGVEALEGKTVFVYIEQGLGDTIQFYRFVAPLIERGAKVIFSGQDCLRQLLEKSAPCVDVIASTEVPAAFDFHIPLASIPLAIRLKVDAIPAAVPYLGADPELKELWGRRLGAHGFKVGIAWQGGTVGDTARSFPLRMFEKIGQLPDVRLINLQKGFGTEQLSELPRGMAVERFDGLDDASGAFVDTAAIMANLDLVITPDTSIAHLAGALARPVIVMLKEVPDWRWLLDRDDSPWYPTMRLFRQKRFADWNSAFDLLYVHLLERSRSRQ